MKIALIGSGSGGHIYPCIAFYQYATSFQHQCSVFLFKEIDEKIYQQQNIHGIVVPTTLSSYKKYQFLKKQFAEQQLDCLITFGGKVSFIATLAAKKLKIPVYLCEQNVVFGKANQCSLIFAKKVFLSFPIKENEKYIYTGNPVVENFECKKISLFETRRPTILIVCGSLGSSTVLDKIKDFVEQEKKINFIVILGKNNENQVFTEDNHLKVFHYYEPLRDLIYSSDLIISRAGATTMSEIIAAEKPCIFIPSPYVTNNHQYKNALFLTQKEACLMIEEKNLTTEKLKEYVYKILYSQYEIYRIKKHLKELQFNHPCQKMLKIIEEAKDGE